MSNYSVFVICTQRQIACRLAITIHTASIAVTRPIDETLQPHSMQMRQSFDHHNLVTGLARAGVSIIP